MAGVRFPLTRLAFHPHPAAAVEWCLSSPEDAGRWNTSFVLMSESVELRHQVGVRRSRALSRNEAQ